MENKEMQKTNNGSNVPATNKGERFFNKIVLEAGADGLGNVALTEHQKNLLRGYFYKIDMVLKEEGIDWKKVDLGQLAPALLAYARMGLDMNAKNHLFPVPYEIKKTGIFTMNLQPGYNGIAYIALKYAVKQPKRVITELVYDTDIFEMQKGGYGAGDNYRFEIVNPFNRGNIIGGFGYIVHEDETENELIIMPLAQIIKRKSISRSTKFWEPWYEEMCYKTLVRYVYNERHIPIDPKKIDDNYYIWKQQEIACAEIETQAEIGELANKTMFLEEPTTDVENADLPTSDGSETASGGGEATPNF